MRKTLLAAALGGTIALAVPAIAQLQTTYDDQGASTMNQQYQPSSTANTGVGTNAAATVDATSNNTSVLGTTDTGTSSAGTLTTTTAPTNTSSTQTSNGTIPRGLPATGGGWGASL